MSEMSPSMIQEALDFAVALTVDMGDVILSKSHEGFGATEILIKEAGGRFEQRSVKGSERCSVIFGKPPVVQWVLGQMR